MLTNPDGMKHGILIVLVQLFSSFLLQAQKADLYVKSGEKSLYLEHKVAPKESFFSVGRLYNVHPKHIAGFNKLDINKGLQIDQRLRIPLTDTNFTQKGNSGTPVYFKAGAPISLVQVSQSHNNVPASSLRSWNGLSGDQVKKDSKLIIGFLLSKEMPSVTIKAKPVAVTEEKVENTPPPPVLVEAKKEPVKPAEEPTPQPEIKQPEIRQPEKKEEKSVSPPVIEPGTENMGYFKTSFDQQVKKTPVSKEETVTSGIFKTASGWQDQKYYMLIDGVAPGTIIRISNPSNTRVIFAKVLGEMNGIRQNEGFAIRMSNAAAAALAISDTEKFIVKINY